MTVSNLNCCLLVSLLCLSFHCSLIYPMSWLCCAMHTSKFKWYVITSVIKFLKVAYYIIIAIKTNHLHDRDLRHYCFVKELLLLIIFTPADNGAAFLNKLENCIVCCKLMAQSDIATHCLPVFYPNRLIFGLENSKQRLFCKNLGL